MVNGWGASLTWNGQGIYVTECASNSNKGLYNSVLWMGNMATYISGNLMAAFVISYLSESLFYMIMTAILSSQLFTSSSSLLLIPKLMTLRLMSCPLPFLLLSLTKLATL